MFRRKLQALEYHSPDNIDVNNIEDLRALLIWLEDQKIRHYKIEDRNELRSNTGEKWIETFSKYLMELECPYDLKSELSAAVDWLLGVAVRYEFGDNCQNFHEISCGLNLMLSHLKSVTLRKSSLDIDPANDTFKAGVQAMAKIVQVTGHPDASLLLEAVRIVIEEHLTDSTLGLDCQSHQKADKLKDMKKRYSPTTKECGVNMGDKSVSEAAKVLRLLHIKELRNLQTSINELIVAVQTVTANPKTDQSLGKVGK